MKTVNKKRPLNIVITQFWSFGGGLAFLHYIANHLSLLGHSVTCVLVKNRMAKKKPPPFRDSLYKEIWLESCYGIYPLSVLNFFLRYLRTHKVDVLISTGPEAVCLSPILKTYSIPHIASYHHPKPFYVPVSRLLNLLRWINPKTIGKQLYQLDNYFGYLRLHKADVVHCLSHLHKEETASALRLQKEKIVVIYYGVDLNLFQPSEQHSNGNHLIYLGGLVEIKGINELFEALSLIKDKEFILDILGGGDWMAYQEKAIALGIGEKIRYHGHVEYNKLPSYFRDASIVIVPTYFESFGLVSAEGMASGLPVIASDIPPIKGEILEDGKTGILFPLKNVKELSMAIETLLSNPSKAFEMGMAGRARVEKLFSWENAASKMEELIFQFLK